MGAVAYRDKVYLRTTDGAPRGRLFLVDPAHPERAAWKEIVPEDKERTLDEVRIVGGRLALSFVKDARSVLETRGLDGGAAAGARTIELPGIGSSTPLAGSPDDDEAYYEFTSYTAPKAVSRVSVRTGKSTPWAASSAKVSPERFAVTQVSYRSKDGTMIPMFVVKGRTPKDGSLPFMLNGYGGFNVSHDAVLRRRSRVAREGRRVASAILRGGGEYGEDWHQAGMLAQEAERLRRLHRRGRGAGRRRGDTAPDRLAIGGGIQRRPPRRRRDDPAAGALRRSSAPCRCSTWCGTRFGVGQDLDQGVRRADDADAVPRAPRVLALPPRGARHANTRPHS